MTQSKNCQKLDFEADSIKKNFNKKTFFSVSKSMKFTFIMQSEYCQKLEFEADPFDKLKPLVKKMISKPMIFLL